LDPDRAPLVRRAFELVAAGTHTRTEVLAVVSATGLRTRTTGWTCGGNGARVPTRCAETSRHGSRSCSGAKGVLDNAFLFERRIDDSTYEKGRDEIREEIGAARLTLEDARIEEIDVEGLLRYAEFVMEGAAALWTDASPQRRVHLQSVLFPEGLRFRDDRFGTAVTCLAFAQLPANLGAECEFSALR
jgi:hypothetical protein